MSMSIPRRQEACLHFIRNGFDADQTIAWMRTEYVNEPSLQNATHPEKLCRNVITMGASGDQKEMNIAAFSKAFDVFLNEERDRESSMNRQKVVGLETDVKTANDRWATAQTELNARERRLAELQQKIEDLTRRNHQYALTEAKEPVPTA